MPMIEGLRFYSAMEITESSRKARETSIYPTFTSADVNSCELSECMSVDTIQPNRLHPLPYNQQLLLVPNHLRALLLPRLFIHRLSISGVALSLTLRARLLPIPVSLCLQRTPLSFAPVLLRDVCAPVEELGKELAANYLADALLRSPALLGSLDMLGNPT